MGKNGYTFEPDVAYARALGRDVRVSPKNAAKLCKVLRGKKLSVAKRLISDLVSGKRSLQGKYYTKAAKEILGLLASCEKNAEFKNLDNGRLFVHASATHGTIMHRRRRRAGFGSRVKTANIEVVLLEKGKSVFKEKRKESKAGRKEAGSKEADKEKKAKPGVAVAKEEKVAEVKEEKKEKAEEKAEKIEEK